MPGLPTAVFYLKEKGRNVRVDGRIFLHTEVYAELGVAVEVNFHDDCQWVRFYEHPCAPDRRPKIIQQRPLSHYEEFEGNMEEFAAAVLEGKA